MATLNDLEDASMFTSAADMFTNGGAYYHHATGQIYLIGDDEELNTLPDGVDLEDCVRIIGRNQLQAGASDAFQFVDMYLSAEREKVSDMFQSRGAFRRFKRFLDVHGKLSLWHDFESGHIKEALKKWCKNEAIPYEDD